MVTGHTITTTQRVYSDAFRSMISIGRRSVKDGCAVIQHSPADLGVRVGSGTLYISSSEVSVSLTDLSITTPSSTYPRIDDVLVTTTGIPVIIDGTPATDPVPPDWDVDDYVIVGRVLVPISASTITTSDITDLRPVFENVGGVASVTAFTSDVFIATEGIRVAGESVGVPRANTSEVILLNLNTTAYTTSSLVLTTSNSFIVKSYIRNHGPEVAWIDFDAYSAVSPSLANTLPMLPGDELILEDHDFAQWGGLTSTSATTLEITNIIGPRSTEGAFNKFNNKREIKDASGNGTFNTSFVTLTTSVIRDVHMICIGTSDVWVSLTGTSTTSKIKILTLGTRQFANVPFDRFYFSSEATTQVRILGIGYQ